MGLVKAVCLALAAECALSVNMLLPTKLSEKELEAGLRKGLEPLAGAFVEIEEEYGINSALYASMVALESGWAESDLSQEKNNITSCREGGEYKAYESKEECLWDMAEKLSVNYLDADGKYYDGGTEIQNVACYYLLGKSRSSMTDEEKAQVDDYVDRIVQIYNSIVTRSLESVDNNDEKLYYDDNRENGGEEMNKEDFGNQLKAKRTEKGKTQTDCAKYCGVCLETYQKWERGLSFPKEDKYDKIQGCLGVKLK